MKLNTNLFSSNKHPFDIMNRQGFFKLILIYSQHLVIFQLKIVSFLQSKGIFPILKGTK